MVMSFTARPPRVRRVRQRRRWRREIARAARDDRPAPPEGPSDGYDEAPGIAVAKDSTHGRMVEVGAEHGDRPVRIALAERAPRLPRLLQIGVKMAIPAGLGDLDGVMN